MIRSNYITSTGNETVAIPEGFLPFGPMYGDAVILHVDDGSSEAIKLGTDIVIFGSRSNTLYVSLNSGMSL